MTSPRRTPYQPYGSAVYRREIRVTLESGRAIGELIDDFHHFRATIEHDGRRVLRVVGEAVRYPWATCAGAEQPLLRLIGMPLAASPRAAARHTNSHAQCTHLFDAASLAIARAGRGAPSTVYRIAIPDMIDGGTRVQLSRDGVELLAWELRGWEIVSPPPFAGRSLHGGLADWAESELDAATSEAVLALQRACVIAGGRMLDLESYARADQVQPNPMGRCHTYTLGIVENGARMLGSVRNLTAVEDLHAASVAGLVPARRR